MSMDAPEDVTAFLASRPRRAVIANLFTFTLLSGPIYLFTDWRRPIPGPSSLPGSAYSPGPPRLVRGPIRVERGMVVSTQQIEVQEANAEFIGLIARGYFNRAFYRMDRVFAAAPGQPWTSPLTKFVGRVNSIDAVTSTSAKITVKSMLDDLDNDFPREVIEPDCDAVLFDDRCGLSASAFLATGTVGTGSTKNAMVGAAGNPDDFWTQGVLTFTSGIMSGFSYMVKSYKSGIVTPAWPFLVPPTAGDTFSLTPGCDKQLATCIGKYSYNPSSGAAPFFRGKPFVPDPTVTY